MSEVREQLIKEGKLITVDQKQIAERLAPQLFEIAKRAEDSSVPAENLAWRHAERDVQAVFLAIARYVAGTYVENARLRAKNAKLEQEVSQLYARLQDAHEHLIDPDYVP